MEINKHQKSLALKKTILARSLALALGGIALAGVPAQWAFAQSSSGSITVKAGKGATIVVESKQIGLTRSVKADADGSVQITQLPSGTYVVTATSQDGTTQKTSVLVQAGQGVEASFGTLMRVEVVGRQGRGLDVKSTEFTQTLTKSAIDRIPSAKDVTAITLLSPGSVQGDGRMTASSTRAANIPSLGGASPAENTYYINGFNVTNIVNGLAYSEVPFEAIGEHQVKTGGYGAEYGRSLGGVISINTKRGTDEWKGGVSASYSPQSMSGSAVYPKKNAAGGWDLIDRPGGRDDTKVNAWIGGPLIQDKLYIFALAQGANFKSNVYDNTRQTEVTNTSPTALVKLDWNITKNNLLEFTSFTDQSRDNLQTWVSPVSYKETRGADLGVSEFTTGGTNNILKWTSFITDDLNLSVLYGTGKYSRGSKIAGATCPVVSDDRATPSVTYGCATVDTITDPSAGDKRDAFRVDLEYTVGKHRVKAGLDREEFTITDGTFYPGGIGYSVNTVNAGGTLDNGYVNNTGADLDYVSARYFANGGTFKIKNSAWYVEDTYQLTKNLLISAGIRNEQFTNLNADGIAFIDVKNTWAPRFAAAWDVNGDSSLKVFGNLGRYYIPVYGNTNVRLSGAELDYTDFYKFNGVFGAAPNEVPGSAGALGPRKYNQTGTAKNPLSVVDPNIKPLNQDELILGFQKALSDGWSYGVKFTHRRLNEGMDDVCEAGNAVTWALGKGYTQAQANVLGNAIDICFLANPGRDLTANVDLNGNGVLVPVTVPASVLGNPAPERTYDAVELTFERAWDKKWSFQGSYVYARSRGNTEGYVKSDIGQADAGISQDFDHPGLMEYSYGPLANNRTHTLKFFGSYAVTDEWRLGGSYVAQSGRPKNCFGYYNGTADGNTPNTQTGSNWNGSVDYGPSSFYCNGVPVPRGSLGDLDWTHQLNLQVAYTPSFIKGLSLTTDVLNVFNERTPRAVNERGESALGTPRASYLRPDVGSISAARTVRFTAQYEF